MNAKRFVLAALAVIGVVMFTDYLIHGVWLKEAYVQTMEMWRPEPETLDRMGWVVRGQVLFAVALVSLWHVGFASRGATLRHALVFGLLAALFKQSETLVSYAVQPIPGSLALRWFLAGAAQGLLAAVITSAIDHPPPGNAAATTLWADRRWMIVGLAMMLFIFASPLIIRGTAQNEIRVTADWMNPVATRWVTESPGKAHSIQSTSEIQKNGIDSLRFELRKDERWTDSLGRSSFRTEAGAKDFPPMRSVRWYRFGLYLPEDFPLEENRLVLAQWHGVDKRLEGEVSRSPVLAFRYVNGRFYITLRHTSERIVKNAEAVPQTVLFETNSFPHAEWSDFVVHARWSFQEDGFVNIWRNNQPIVRYRGPVGYNDRLGPDFRFGLYRDATDKTYVAYFSDVKIGTAPEDIGFIP